MRANAQKSADFLVRRADRLSHFVAVTLALCCLAACTQTRLPTAPSAPQQPVPQVATTTNYMEMPAGGLSCVPYVRQRTGTALYGDAYSWWDNAAGLYPRGNTPELGAVLVLRQTARLASGHVAVVSRVIGPRQILVDHANWIPGEVVINMPVVDVSPRNDWSQLRFWYRPAGTFGAVYPAAGFIYAAVSAPSRTATVTPNESVPGPQSDQTVTISGDGVSVGSQ